MKKISIVIPIYNAENYLAQCIDSVLAQHYENIEILCIDDGSTDCSSEIVNTFIKNDSRIIYIKKNHTNAGETRNWGIDNCTGEYVMFLDSDDYIEPGIIQSCYTIAEKDNSDIVVFKYRLVDAINNKGIAKELGIHTNKLKCFAIEELVKNKYTFTNVAVWNKLYRRSFIINNNLRFKGYESLNDMYFGIISLSLANRISLCRQVGVNYRINNTNSLSSKIDYIANHFFSVLTEINNYLIGSPKWKMINYDLSRLEKLQLEEFLRRYSKYDKQKAKQFEKRIELFLKHYFK